jgi:hypothetical protein
MYSIHDTPGRMRGQRHPSRGEGLDGTLIGHALLVLTTGRTTRGASAPCTPAGERDMARR